MIDQKDMHNPSNSQKSIADLKLENSGMALLSEIKTLSLVSNDIFSNEFSSLQKILKNVDLLLPTAEDYLLEFRNSVLHVFGKKHGINRFELLQERCKIKSTRMTDEGVEFEIATKDGSVSMLLHSKKKNAKERTVKKSGKSIEPGYYNEDRDYDRQTYSTARVTSPWRQPPEPSYHKEPSESASGGSCGER